jgi:triosephosphate isomerase (TIM)
VTPRKGAQRRPLVSGNWKLNRDHVEALHLVRDLGLRLKAEDVAAVDAAVHPPFTDLRTVQTLLEAEAIPMALGAQHCFDHDSGAFTGEVGPGMLARLHVRYVLVGHSERRHLFGMSDAAVASTLRAVRRHDMVPIVCVGETEEERAAGATQERLHHQVRAAFGGLSEVAPLDLVVAYEPVWAIGTGNAATAEDAQVACACIRSILAELWGQEAAGQVRIQYGGSVNPQNAEELCAQPDVDGLLVGGASLDAASFADILRGAGACYRS